MKVVTNQDFLPVLLTLLGKARKSIDIISFSFAIGSAAGKHSTKSAPYEIALKLLDIKRKYGKKVKIRFFTEGLRETVDRNKVTADFLEEGGVEVRYGSTHAKGFCIDGKYVLFGSTNLTQQSIMKNHEANLLIEDTKTSKGFRIYFEHLWNGGHHGDITLPKPFFADGDFKDELIRIIDHAKKKIDFSIYFFNHREIEEALIDAFERGAKIRGFIHQHASFALPYIWANRSTVKRLKNAGMDDLHWGPLHLFSHAKYLVADGKTVFMSTGNWLVQDVEIHPQLSIAFQDVKIARSLIRHLTWQINSTSTLNLQKKSIRPSHLHP